MSWLTAQIGNRFGSLRVIGVAPRANRRSAARAAILCDCGATKTVEALNIKKGLTQSCGCMQKKAMHARRIPELKRFWRFVKKGGVDECWNWTGGKSKLGYGLFSVHLPNHPDTAKAYRISWEIANQASLLPGSVIMHTCDNPPCVNPAHLKLGTHKENVQDMCAKGRKRISRGESHSCSKMTEAQVTAARHAASNKKTIASISREMNLPYSALWSAIRGKTWKHV